MSAHQPTPREQVLRTGEWSNFSDFLTDITAKTEIKGIVIGERHDAFEYLKHLKNALPRYKKAGFSLLGVELFNPDENALLKAAQEGDLTAQKKVYALVHIDSLERGQGAYDLLKKAWQLDMTVVGIDTTPDMLAMQLDHLNHPNPNARGNSRIPIGDQYMASELVRHYRTNGGQKFLAIVGACHTTPENQPDYGPRCENLPGSTFDPEGGIEAKLRKQGIPTASIDLLNNSTGSMTIKYAGAVDSDYTLQTPESSPQTNTDMGISYLRSAYNLRRRMEYSAQAFPDKIDVTGVRDLSRQLEDSITQCKSIEETQKTRDAILGLADTVLATAIDTADYKRMEMLFSGIIETSNADYTKNCSPEAEKKWRYNPIRPK